MAHKIKQAEITDFRKLSLAQGQLEYAKLRSDIIKAGILKRDYFYYSVLFGISTFGFASSLYLFYSQNQPLLLVVIGIVVAFFVIQVGGLVHDAGHRAVFKSTFLNDVLGYICSAFVTFAYANWKLKHNAHHAHVNEEGEDPDIEIPFAFTDDRYKNARGMRGLIRKYQMWLYYPLGSLVTFTMRFKALKYYLSAFSPSLAPELLIFIIGTFCWYILPFVLFPLWKAILFVVIVNPAVGLYMLNIFAPNHKGMTQLGRGVKFSFLEHQIITARNIYGHWLTDYVYLGLNYQIEHHLFPNCPRNKLKLITPYVLAICRKYRLPYTQMNIIDSNRFILSELHTVSKT